MKKFLAAAAVVGATLAFALGVHAEDALGRILAMEGQERLEFLQARSHGERVEFLEYFVTLGRGEKLAFLESLTNDEIEEIRAPLAEIVTRILGEYGALDDGSGSEYASYLTAHKDRDGVVMGMLEFASLEATADGAKAVARRVLNGRQTSRLMDELERAEISGEEFANLSAFIRSLEYDGSFFTLDDVRAMYGRTRFERPRGTSEIAFVFPADVCPDEYLKERLGLGDGTNPEYRIVDTRANLEHGIAEPFTQTRTVRHDQSSPVLDGIFVMSIAIHAMQANEGMGWANVHYIGGLTQHFFRATHGTIIDWIVWISEANPRLQYSVYYRYSWRSSDGSISHTNRQLNYIFELPTPRSTGLRALPHGEDD